MEKPFQKKITWTIKSLNSFHGDQLYSDQFLVGGCKWRLSVSPKGNNSKDLYLFLEVADYESLPSGWRRHVRYILRTVNQNNKIVIHKMWFDENTPRRRCLSVFPGKEIHARFNRFPVNGGELKIVAEIEVLEVIGDLDVTEKTSSTMLETIDVYGFQLLPSQVEPISRIFESFPEIASKFSPKNPNLWTGYMNLLLSLIDTLREPPQKLNEDDLDEVYAALEFMSNSGFELDWLKMKLEEVLEKKVKEEASKTRMQEIEQELKILKLKCSDLEAELEKEKSEVSAAKAPLSFDGVI